jgi:hypothetical protein
VSFPRAGCGNSAYGLIEREWMNAKLRTGSQAILRCKYHRPPECQSWAASRVSLWQASANGEKTPEGWARRSSTSWLIWSWPPGLTLLRFSVVVIWFRQYARSGAVFETNSTPLGLF